MHRIPKTPLILGLLGLLPFVWGVVTLWAEPLAIWGARNLGPRFVGPYVQLFYGSVILSFMSGVLWGFAARAQNGQAAIGYILSVIPALWAFFMTGGGPCQRRHQSDFRIYRIAFDRLCLFPLGPHT